MCTSPLIAADQYVTIDGRKLFLHCEERHSSSSPTAGPTVLLLAGGGAPTVVWSAVQSAASKFARVCSYDRAGVGKSDKPPHPQTAEEVASDIEGLIREAALPGPYVVVGHSIGGVFARVFASRMTGQIAGIVLVDSSHEEQIWRLAEVSTALLDAEYGTFWRNPEAVRGQGWLAEGARSTWRLDVPLIVIEHGRDVPNPFAKIPYAEFRRIEDVWHKMQQDLAARSKFGELREARNSDHNIHVTQPELVVRAIRDILGRKAKGQ